MNINDFEIRDLRKKRSEYVVIIPSYMKNRLLEYHLKELKKQKFTDFDIIIVYGEKDEFLDEPALHIRGKEKNGSAGAFYTGEKIALKEGYAALILADNDCIPIDHDMIKNLVNEIKEGNKVVFSRTTTDAGKEPHKSNIVNHYSCIHRSVFEKLGLAFAPLYFGGEDLEFTKRIQNAGYVIKQVESAAIHPMPVPIMINNESKKYHYIRGGIEALLLSGNYFRAYISVTMHLLAAVAFRLLGRKKLSMACLLGVFDASMLRFFQRQFKWKDSAPVEKSLPKKVLTIENSNDEFLSLANLPARKDIPYLKRLFLSMKETVSKLPFFWKYFRKEIVFVDVNEPGHLPIMLLSKTAYLKFKGKTYQLYNERSMFLSIISLPIILLFFPLAFIISLLLLINGILKIKFKKIKTKGYGLPI